MIKRLSFIFLLLMGLAWADNPAVVTQIDPGGVSVNFGARQQAASGQEFYVYHEGQWVGRLRLTQVGDNTSSAQIVQTVAGSSVQVGDVVSSFAPTPATQPAMAPSPYIPAYSGPSFPEVVHKNTRSFSFGGGMPGTPPAFQSSSWPSYTMMAAPLFMGGLGSASPWFLGSTGMMVMTQQHAQKQMREAYKSNQSELQVVYWDTQLTQAYASAYVADSETDPMRQAQLRQNVLAQKGVDKNYIFQIHLLNRGFAPFQVGPFNQHFFLLDSHGGRLAARRYDEALDGSIPAGGEVQGYVYFDRFDAYGNPRLNGPVKVVVDNVQGAGATFTW
ncbi:MAG TPA: hypothetical protein VGO93_23345 [Candidatus Xenobia bacterium]|jgi:hypothetical protein